MVNTEATQIFVHIEHSTGKEKHPRSIVFPPLPPAFPTSAPCLSLPKLPPSGRQDRPENGAKDNADGPVTKVWDVAVASQ